VRTLDTRNFRTMMMDDELIAGGNDELLEDEELDEDEDEDAQEDSESESPEDAV